MKNNNIVNRTAILVSILLIVVFCDGCAASIKSSGGRQYLSPNSYGLRSAKTDIDRYQVLLATHRAAILGGFDVDYSGIKTINIEIPDKMSTIPLTAHTDFHGCIINVRNKVGNVTLFTRSAIAREVVLTRKQVDEGRYSSVRELRNGINLLILEDKTPWVENREGHDYPAYRKDIIVLDGGKARNSPIMPYNTEQTFLYSTYIPIRDTLVQVSNVVINRTKDSSGKTFCFSINGSYNVRMENITVNTPEGSGLWADGVISMNNCAVVRCDKIRINGTYSLKDKYGYGFNLDNIYDFSMTNSYGHGNWGVFGTNNINTFHVSNSDLNRVDIHLYGRDVTISNCKLSAAYNQFSGVYGDIIMERCSFDDFTPLINGNSYNTYVPYNLIIKDCEWTASIGKQTLLRVGTLNNKINHRQELAKKSWPNIYIDGLKVNVLKGVSNVYLIYVSPEISYKRPIDNISEIYINRLTFEYDKSSTPSASLMICNTPVKVESDFTCILDNVHLLNGGEGGIKQATTKHFYPGSVIYNLHSATGEKFSVKNSTLGYNVNSSYEYNLEYDNCTLTHLRCTPSDLKEYTECHRTYRNCRLYLNSMDSQKYYLDNLARYEGCELIPCSDKEIGFYGKTIDVHFKNCISRTFGNKTRVKANNTREFVNGHFDGQFWTTE